MGQCAHDPTVRLIDARIANATGFSWKNMEYLLRAISMSTCPHSF